MSLLAEAFGEGSILLNQKANSWQESIELAGAALVASKRTTAEYSQQMIDAVIEFGPYMVITEGVALAHAKPGESVLSTGLALVVLREPVVFGIERFDPVSLVLGLAAIDHETHLSMLAELAELLNDKEKINILLRSESEREVRTILN
jgi:ascorbate PTS system EIIA or EIIAB component